MLKLPQKFLMLGAGELGKEFVIAAKRLGNYVVAVDRYTAAPAMQVADESEIISMLDGESLEKVIAKHKPDFIVPEIEAIKTEKLLELESQGFKVVPTASAVNYTMNRDRIRDLASRKLGLRTAKYAYASSLDELLEASKFIGFPNVVKPVMSSSGKGQSLVQNAGETADAWNFAIAGARGDQPKVIVEEFIEFESEITLLTVKPRQGPTLFCPPIGHRQERGDYQESWQSHELPLEMLKEAQSIAHKVTEALGGAGLFGVEFFITKNEVIFSELSPRPHDTGMVTLISQNINQFELHLRAILGLPIPEIEVHKPAASAVILANTDLDSVQYTGFENALTQKEVEVRIFGKPDAKPYRRMGIALAKGNSLAEARQKATEAASQIQVLKG